MNDLKKAYHAGQAIGGIIVIVLFLVCACTVLKHVK